MIRFLRSVGGIVKFSLILLYGTLELILKRPATYEHRAEWLHQFCGKIIRAMGIATRVEGSFPERGVVVSNHMGYLDIMALAAHHRCVFMAAAELGKVPLLGWMTTMAGTVYVHRGQGGSAERAQNELQATADAGVPIVIFAEGTTSDGNGVLPFRSGALAQVLEAGQPVTAAFVSYRFTEDNGPDATIETDVAYWGDDVQLFPHIFNLVALRGIEVRIRIAQKPIAFTVGADQRKQAAMEARTAVMELGGVRDAVVAS